MPYRIDEFEVVLIAVFLFLYFRRRLAVAVVDVHHCQPAA